MDWIVGTVGAEGGDGRDVEKEEEGATTEGMEEERLNSGLNANNLFMFLSI